MNAHTIYHEFTNTILPLEAHTLLTEYSQLLLNEIESVLYICLQNWEQLQDAMRQLTIDTLSVMRIIQNNFILLCKPNVSECYLYFTQIIRYVINNERYLFAEGQEYSAHQKPGYDKCTEIHYH